MTQTPGAADAAATAIGVGIDTARYGHHATFLRPDLQPAAADLDFVESAAGYQQLRARLETIVQRLGAVHFHFRLDVAGAYADNLLAFLHAWPEPKTISCGEPQRNKNYRVALFGHKKSDPVESAAVARYALTEKPKPTTPLPPQVLLLRQVAGRLEAQARQCTRLGNQLHQLLARSFPELALLTKDIASGWVLKLLDRYSTAAKLAAARTATLEAIPYLPHELIPKMRELAGTSIASLTGPVAEQLVRDQVRQVKEAHQRQKSLEKLLVAAYRALPEDNQLTTIKGIGDVTAAILTARIVAIDRFESPEKLVGYFGAFPVEASSGLDRDGRPRPAKRYVMCPRGSDLVRRYLYNAALSAAQFNPAVKPMYQRVRAKHPDHPAIAVGHAMGKLLHLVFAVWKSGKPFDPQHYPWDKPKPAPASDLSMSAKEPAAGHNPVTAPDQQVVTAAGSISSSDSGNGRRPRSAAALDFAHIKAQLSVQHVLAQLGLSAALRGRGHQRRGPCPVHGHGQGRTFSVHLDKNVFQCFDPSCGIKGDVIDLWAALKKLPLRQAALDLVATFRLEPTPPAPRTEKRHG
jgi:transposase